MKIFSYSPNPKLDLSGFLIWSSNKNGQKNRNLIDYTNPNIPDDVTESTTNQTSNTGLVKLGSIYRKNINNQMNYDFIGRFSNEFRTDNTSSQVVGNNIIEKENATPFRINQNLSYFDAGSNCRMPSSVSPKKSKRIGSVSPGGKMSIMPPRIE